MKIIRKNFSEVNKDPKKKLSDGENDPKYIVDQGIVGGTTTALIGGSLLAGNKYLTKKGITNSKRVKNMKKIGYVALPVGVTLAGLSAYKKAKLNKNQKK